MIEFLILCNGFIVALMIGVVGAAVYALRSIKQGREVLTEISRMHNELTETVMKIDQRSNEAILRLDHMKGQQ